MREHKNLPVQFMDRIGAYGVDMITVFFFILAKIFMGWNIIQAIIYIFGVYTLITIVPAILYRGQSIGKIMGKTIVLTSDYNEVPLRKYILRMYFIMIFSILSFLLYPLVAIILLESRMDKRSIHDFIFDTRVVLKDSKLN